MSQIEEAAALLDVPAGVLETYLDDDRAYVCLAIPDGASGPADGIVLRKFGIREFVEKVPSGA